MSNQSIGLFEAKTRRSCCLSADDALCFELALRRKAALATYDDVMIAAAPSAGIRLYPPVVAASELS